ncbi:dihydropteroate synthase [Alicyclobacillus dauci]|uniref:Dihydropteroate synthase n=1 Tax=Alicyclobacillus dauci TaxID=1475485 RepID=A0ABY6Z386_9BACL|nr:dihydropteroate synthase [Alicyclobacillus dauci]WAH37354.1 dihydropteroate synthase [Alicyclobacillus dauci]
MAKCSVMGILNVTPDSFSDGGRYTDVAAAIARAEEMVADGADIIDVGAESTRPGYVPVDPDVEWARLNPVLQHLVAHSPVPISVDTYHAETAARCIDIGVQIINDISACADNRMIAVVRDSDAKYVFMHNRRTTLASLPVEAIVSETALGVDRLLDGGVRPEQIIVDPGVGFAKTQAQNLACIREIDQFGHLGYPVLLGTSRKRVIANVLDVPVDERLEGSLATVAYGALHGVHIVRVHDVKETARLCRMLEAVTHVPTRGQEK